MCSSDLFPSHDKKHERFYKKEFDFTVHDKIMYLKIPNKTTQKAMDDVRNGKNTESTTIEQIK